MTREERREALRDRYEKWWPVSAAREEMIKDMLEQALDTTVETYGTGALNTQRIKGSARDNGFEPADPDLYSPEYGCFFEVTGPLKPYIHPQDRLFVNPDKVRNAVGKFRKGTPVWLVHVLDRKGVREQVLSTAGDLLPEEIKSLICEFYLTDTARCRLGKLCDFVSKGKACPEEVASLAEKLYRKHVLIKPNGSEESIVRCFLMDEEFYEQFKDDRASFLGETFVQVPSDWYGVLSFRDMVKRIRS